PTRASRGKNAKRPRTFMALSPLEVGAVAPWEVERQQPGCNRGGVKVGPGQHREGAGEGVLAPYLTVSGRRGRGLDARLDVQELAAGDDACRPLDAGHAHPLHPGADGGAGASASCEEMATTHTSPSARMSASGVTITAGRHLGLRPCGSSSS